MSDSQSGARGPQQPDNHMGQPAQPLTPSPPMPESGLSSDSSVPPQTETVTWNEVRDHLATRLMMDAEWVVHGGDFLQWWPSPLPMTIRVVGSGTFLDSRDNWLRVSGSTCVAKVDEPFGRRLAIEFGREFPVGAVVYRDGALYLTTIYALNPLNRELLEWFHDSLLIQAAQAFQFAVRLVDDERVEIPTPAHPVSGERSDVDELLRIYAGDELGLPTKPFVLERFQALRPQIRHEFLAKGWQEGFSNEEVDYFNLGFATDDDVPAEAFYVGFGFMRGTDMERRLGPSMSIVAPLLPRGLVLDRERVTYASFLLCDLPMTSVFGRISGPEASEGGTSLWATVPHLTLAGWATKSDHFFRTAVTNAISHVTAAAQAMRRDVFGIKWPPHGVGGLE